MNKKTGKKKKLKEKANKQIGQTKIKNNLQNE